jgi:hypothetical protein
MLDIARYVAKWLTIAIWVFVRSAVVFSIGPSVAVGVNVVIYAMIAKRLFNFSEKSHFKRGRTMRESEKIRAEIKDTLRNLFVSRHLVNSIMARIDALVLVTIVERTEHKDAEFYDHDITEWI